MKFNATRKLSVLAGVLVAGTLVLASAGAAQAATAISAACPAEVSHPNISLGADPQYQGYSITQTCGAVSAAWEIVAADGYDHGGIIIPGFAYTDYYADSFDVGAHLGKYMLAPAGAYDASYSDVPQATEYFYVKLRTHATPDGYRSGHWVYMRAHITRYNSDANYGAGGYTGSPSRYVTISDYYSGAWHVAGHKYTNVHGWTSYLKVWAPTYRNFKVSASSTPTRWGKTSGNLYR